MRPFVRRTAGDRQGKQQGKKQGATHDGISQSTARASRRRQGMLGSQAAQEQVLGGAPLAPEKFSWQNLGLAKVVAEDTANPAGRSAACNPR